MRDDRQRLIDIVEAIKQIEKHTSQGRDAFEKNELVQVWVLHHLPTLKMTLEKLIGHDGE